VSFGELMNIKKTVREAGAGVALIDLTDLIEGQVSELT
jgi:hypothetical protein